MAQIRRSGKAGDGDVHRKVRQSGAQGGNQSPPWPKQGNQERRRCSPGGAWTWFQAPEKHPRGLREMVPATPDSRVSPREQTVCPKAQRSNWDSRTLAETLRWGGCAGGPSGCMRGAPPCCLSPAAPAAPASLSGELARQKRAGSWHHL